MTTQPQTPAPRPAACDLDTARKLAEDLIYQVGTGYAGRVFADPAMVVARADVDKLAHDCIALAADLDATRAERDAALAALPPAVDLDYWAAIIEGRMERGVLPANMVRRAAAAVRALSPAPVPAADVADVPAFLLGRVNGGAA